VLEAAVDTACHSVSVDIILSLGLLSTHSIFLLRGISSCHRRVNILYLLPRLMKEFRLFLLCILVIWLGFQIHCEDY
jgi:hypothetical protein